MRPRLPHCSVVAGRVTGGSVVAPPVHRYCCCFDCTLSFFSQEGGFQTIVTVCSQSVGDEKSTSRFSRPLEKDSNSFPGSFLRSGGHCGVQKLALLIRERWQSKRSLVECTTMSQISHLMVFVSCFVPPLFCAPTKDPRSGF